MTSPTPGIHIISTSFEYDRIVLPALLFASMLNRENGTVKLFYVEPEGYYEGQALEQIFRCLDPDVDKDALFQELKELADKIKNSGFEDGV